MVKFTREQRENIIQYQYFSHVEIEAFERIAKCVAHLMSKMTHITIKSSKPTIYRGPVKIGFVLYKKTGWFSRAPLFWIDFEITKGSGHERLLQYVKYDISEEAEKVYRNDERLTEKLLKETITECLEENMRFLHPKPEWEVQRTSLRAITATILK